MEIGAKDVIKIIYKLSNDDLTKIYNDYSNKIIKDNDDTRNDKVIDKTTDKYKLLLKFINSILINIGKSQVDDLTEFKDIDREDIIKDVNKQTLNAMEKELFKTFDKKKCGYYRKTDSIVLNCLRGMCKEVGLDLFNRKLSRTLKCKVSSHYLYTIRY